jgi:hypothetical protein
MLLWDGHNTYIYTNEVLVLTIFDNYKIFTNLHTVQITTALTMSSQSVMSSLVVAC